MWREKDESTKSAPTSTDDESHVANCARIASGFWSLWLLSFNDNFEKLCGCKVSDVLSFEKFTQLLYRPTDPASLGVARALFGLCMVIDVVEERGFSNIDIKWGDPWECHFPLIHGMGPPSLPWMIMLYTVMWIGAFGIALGLRFKLACACFALPYWYIFLLDKSYWNNHTYLYGIVAILFWGTGADKYFALDANKARHHDDSVPYWNYFILKFQFFLLYFLAGLKKSSREWLEGYAMTNLSRHWVFYPFHFFLTTEQTDYLIVHWFAFIFDLTVGFWMLLEKTRIPAMVLCTAFHLMNTRLFSIGMFPYVCLATMPLFCRVDWPRKLGHYFNWRRRVSAADVKPIDENRAKAIDDQRKDSTRFERCASSSNEILDNETTHEGKEEVNRDYFTGPKSEEKINKGDDDTQLPENSIESGKEEDVNVREKIPRAQRATKVTKKQKLVVSILLCHIALQFFLPYSHFISKGYNNWVPGLYGYSWDMMVHAWDTVLVVIKVHDNVNNKIRYLDPEAWVQSNRWVRHADMAMQYSQCMKDNLMRRKKEALSDNRQSEEMQMWIKLSANLSIYIDVWCSLNGRFQQRVFDPRVDMLTVDWHPFKPVSFLMPLLTQYNSYRYEMEKILKHVYTWSNYTDVLFVADFPGMHLENYISTDFTNVSLAVLEGEVTYIDEKSPDSTTVLKGRSIPVKTGMFHRVKTTSSCPACYMYTYTNQTQQLNNERTSTPIQTNDTQPLLKEVNYKITTWTRTLSHITNAFFHLVYDVPMVRRVRVSK
ncbi:vitamin K-dependent gamma-carboxylase isoform X2 [Odontomachus brunneus]|uniref:vitamin K-dependent gamma-carboxylase isoform X2 n=1 Tax=Odontomachus brunneus TaxID=486640 RepID=UPI0013F28E1E|nr:vitamin K-dependent gamma-carboxylase isoform X2 [Odontomachus brunneus]